MYYQDQKTNKKRAQILKVKKRATHGKIENMGGQMKAHA